MRKISVIAVILSHLIAFQGVLANTFQMGYIFSPNGMKVAFLQVNERRGFQWPGPEPARRISCYAALCIGDVEGKKRQIFCQLTWELLEGLEFTLTIYGVRIPDFLLCDHVAIYGS